MEKDEPAALDSDSGMGFICIATFLPLRSWKHMISFQLMTWKVLKQIKRSDGIVSWTFSIWKDKDSMHRFTSQEPHATAIKKFEIWAGEGSAFVEWTSKSNKIDWKEGLQKLQNPTFYYRQKG